MSANTSPKFATTRWSMVVAASRNVSQRSRRDAGDVPSSSNRPAGDKPVSEDQSFGRSAYDVQCPTDEANAALESLCETYWPPLYAFAIRRGYSVADAQDLTQDFFAHLMQSDFLAKADADRGRFRTFLLTVFERFAASQWRKASAQKRGGDHATLQLDFGAADEGARLAGEPTAKGMSPDRFFQQQWALTLLSKVIDQLRQEYSHRKSLDLFEALESQWNPGAAPGESYEIVAQRLGMTSGAVKVAAHRIRARYRTVLRELVAETVADEAEVEDEIRDLMNSFSDSV
ncbi:RNA polymerase sigma factor [Crateriforma conspicua]|nr:sigma-70 family RNA polymerase sigma factor [Crateriforma conspicua]